MRILYLSQYFPPEAGATQTRAFEMARNLIQLGHQVTVISEIPNHPSGIIPPAYHKRLLERTQLEGIDVIRVWVKTSPDKTFIRRLLFYGSYMLNATLAGLFLARGRYDLVYATSPPLFVGGSALAIHWLRRLPLFFEVRDLWPESAVALGELANARAIAWATRLEETCYRHARRVVVVTEGIRQRLISRGVPPEKISCVPNGANINLFHFSAGDRAHWRAELGLSGRFIAIYAGILGVAQGLGNVIETARLLQQNQEIHFLIIGDGPRRRQLINLAQKYNLMNLTFLGEKPRDTIPGFLSAADVALVPLRKAQVFETALPSKVFAAWACERPVLLTVEGDARKALDEAGGGWFVPPEDPAALADAILRLKSQPELRAQMGASGRAYTSAHYSRQALAQQLAEIITQTLARHAPGR